MGFGLPFPTLRVFRVHRCSLLLSSAGIFLRTSSLDRPPSWYQANAFEFYRWDDLEPGRLRVEGSALILLGNKHSFPSAGHARTAARTLLQLRGLPADARALATEGVSRSAFDLEALLKRWRQFEPAVLWLRRVTIGYTALLVVGGSTVYFAVPDPMWLRIGLLLTALAYVLLLILLIGTRRRLVAGKTIEGVGVVAGAIMSPPGAALSPIQLGRDLFRGFDALTVVAAMAPPDIARTMITRELEGIDLALESSPESSPESKPESKPLDSTADEESRPLPFDSDSWRETWRCRLSALEALIAALGWDSTNLRKPPTTADLAATTYCSLCREVFQEIGTCPDCELALEPLR
jgi:hypothetical protein